MKKLILLSLLLLVSNQGFAKQCDDGSRPTRVISDDGSFYKSVCYNNKQNTSKRKPTVSTYPLAIQPDSLMYFVIK